VVLVLVEEQKLACASFHLARNLTLGGFIGRPYSICEDFGVELDSLDFLRITHFAPEFFHNIFAQLHVLEHFGDLVHRVDTALNFKLL